jgi:N-acylneuraminate cytidylyltransferase
VNHKAVAVIPARGGSKRIKNKNIRDFAGKPLIAYSIEAAKSSDLFSEIVVSTDSDEIADIALASGASQIIKRPDHLADDFTGTTPVVHHALTELISSQVSFQYVCCIYATAPFLEVLSLKKGFSSLIKEARLKYSFSVTTFDFPIQRALRIGSEGIEPVDRHSIAKRSQDLEECYHDAGQFYWGTKQAWLEQAAVFAPHSAPVIIPRYLVQDIDTEEDWQRAELMYKAYVCP